MCLINVYVQTNHTDAVSLLVAFMPDFLKINAQVIAICGVGTHKYCMSINVIAESCVTSFSPYSTSYSFNAYQDQIICQAFSLLEK